MKILDNVYKLYTPEKANQIAAEMTAEDCDGWKYTANHDPTGQGFSFVEIYDETGEFVGRL